MDTATKPRSPELLADLSAEVVKRVIAFAAKQDPRFYLCGVHVLPQRKPDDVPARIEATNGHLLYAEEDLSGTVQRELIVCIGSRGRSLLKANHRVKVYDDLTVKITDFSGEEVLYIEPGKGVLTGHKYPDIAHLVGMPTDWHEGLRAPVQSQYLLQALSIPGSVRFFSRMDDAGKFSLTSGVMFVMDRSTANGGKGMGLIMPIASRFQKEAGIADMLPASLLARPAEQRVTA